MQSAFSCVLLYTWGTSVVEIKLIKPVIWWWEVLILDNINPGVFWIIQRRIKRNHYKYALLPRQKKKIKVLCRPSLTYLPTYLSSLLNGDQGQVLAIGIFVILAFYFFLYPFTSYQLDPSPRSYTLSSSGFPNWFPSVWMVCKIGKKGLIINATPPFFPSLPVYSQTHIAQMWFPEVQCCTLETLQFFPYSWFYISCSGNSIGKKKLIAFLTLYFCMLFLPLFGRVMDASLVPSDSADKRCVMWVVKRYWEVDDKEGFFS